jgi:hypothetical protein
MPWERSIGKASASKLKIYAKKDGRYDVWYDQVGKRHASTSQTLAAAKSFQAQKIAELQRHRETKFDLDDREMYSLARDLASSHGYTVLQAVLECHRSKGSSNGHAAARGHREVPGRQIEPICGIRGQAQRRYASFSGTFWRQRPNRSVECARTFVFLNDGIRWMHRRRMGVRWLARRASASFTNPRKNSHPVFRTFTPL